MHTMVLSVLLMVGSWTLTLANVRKAFSCLEVTLGTFATSQTTRLHVLLWGDLCWLTTSREGNNGLEFPPFVHSLCDCGFVESKLFRDGFVTFSSLMSNISSFSDVLSNLLCSWHDSLPQTWSYFCNSQIRNTGSFFSINKWERKYFSHLFDSVLFVYFQDLYENQMF